MHAQRHTCYLYKTDKQYRTLIPNLLNKIRQLKLPLANKNSDSSLFTTNHKLSKTTRACYNVLSTYFKEDLTEIVEKCEKYTEIWLKQILRALQLIYCAAQCTIHTSSMFFLYMVEDVNRCGCPKYHCPPSITAQLSLWLH